MAESLLESSHISKQNPPFTGGTVVPVVLLLRIAARAHTACLRSSKYKGSSNKALWAFFKPALRM